VSDLIGTEDDLLEYFFGPENEPLEDPLIGIDNGVFVDLKIMREIRLGESQGMVGDHFPDREKEDASILFLNRGGETYLAYLVINFEIVEEPEEPEEPPVEDPPPEEPPIEEPPE